eukprot:358081-Chlamydomonas_euryale.AAC.5
MPDPSTPSVPSTPPTPGPRACRVARSTIPPPMWTAEQWAHVLVSGMYGQAHKLDAFLLKWHYAMLQVRRGGRAGVGSRVWSGYKGLATKYLLLGKLLNEQLSCAQG